jgi:hypothetical protein
MHQLRAAVLPQDQVDAAVLASPTGLFDKIALSPKSLADYCFEIAPAHRSDAVEPSLGLQALLALPTREPSGQGNDATKSMPPSLRHATEQSPQETIRK